MDFFKFISASDPTTLDQGQHINGIDKAMWVERYNAPGEFSFESKLSSGLREFLPLGTLISHADTYDIMVVENAEISEKEDEDSTVKITGRSFVSLLENRIIGTNAARAGSAITPYTLTPATSWNQIVTIINAHIGNVTNVNDNLTQVVASATVSLTGTESIDRTIEFGDVLSKVLDLLSVDDLGIKTIRKNTFGVGSSTNTTLLIHAGVNRSANVFFSWQGGDVASMAYLFSNKNVKNSALVKGRYVWTVVDLGPTKYSRRMMLVDGSDIDGALDAAPTGATLTSTITSLANLGRQLLKRQTQFTINQSDISKNAPFRYRRDYDIGDLISIGGNYGQISVMRVVEYAEIEDEDGESGHPTLAIIGA